ncbi:hypothetical protein V5735_18495 (plasmid) [Haladaptatus sp. SPP-AMP-3]|uniref:DUF7344 domain-containing protein n=1 Tax=Haladaptatus sp. SPP-AMP-3 TaxID=3121295 RepID=UPI003C2FE23E
MSAREKLSTKSDGRVSVDEPPVENDLSTDGAFHLLQSQRRRAAIRYLGDADGPVEMCDLAEQVAAWENDTTAHAPTSDERQRAHIPSYQSHLPKLDEKGVIDYDKNRGIVEQTPLVSQLECYLDVGRDPDIESEDERRQWNTYYLSVSVLGSVLFTGAAFRFPLLVHVPSLAVMIFVLPHFGPFRLLTRFPCDCYPRLPRFL